MSRRLHRGTPTHAVICFSLVVIAFAGDALADEFNVTRFDDPAPDGCMVGDCSLREAVIASNASGAADTINLPAGTYNLTIAGVAGVDDIDPAISDLDIGTGGLTINGAGAASTTINAAGMAQRAFGMPIDLMFFATSVSINNVTISGGNTTGLAGALNRGGAIDIGSRHATVTLSGVVLTGNTAGTGGGIHTRGNLILTNCRIATNTGSGATLGVDGANFRTLTINSSTISGNTGTGVDVDAGTCNITNSTLSGNGTAGFTGGVDYGGGLTVGTITNCTIANNRYGFIGQNDFSGDPSVNVANTIISGSTVRNIFSTTDAGFARPPNSSGNNIIGDNSGTTFNQTSDKRNTNPLLLPLAVNAPGTTATHAIPANSPAVDMASAGFAPAADQRGIVRPQGAADDIGAFELSCPADGAGGQDSDTDGVGDVCDGCPNDPNKSSPGTCGCGTPDTDSDLDGTANCVDGCPNDPNKTSPGACGCGMPDTDSDFDGTPNCIDGCPNDINKTAPGDCGCGTPDTDTDADGTADCADNCPNDPNKTSPGLCGCGTSDADTDADGTLDCNDGCPNDPNKTAPGTCGCGTSDADTDADGAFDCNDGCPNDSNKTAPGVGGCGQPEPMAGDDDGVDDTIEAQGPNGGDGNQDGTPDSEQDNVTSLPNMNGDYLTVVAPAGAQLVGVSSGDNPSPGDAPAGVEFPAGFINFQVNGLAPGGTVQVDIIAHVPAGTILNAHWKYGPTPDNAAPHWYDFAFDGTTGANISGNVISLTFVDGQRGDADLAADGKIVDPSALAFTADTPPAGQATGCCAPGVFPTVGFFAPVFLVGMKFRRRRHA